MYVTEEDMAALAKRLREEFNAKAAAVQEELAVQIVEAHNRTAGLRLDDVKALLEELGLPGEQLSAEDVQAMIPKLAPCDDEELKAAVLRIRCFANDLADRIGSPRMEG